MNFRCRFLVPRVSRFVHVEADSPSLAAHLFHDERWNDSIRFEVDPKRPGNRVYFALVETEGHGQWVSRIYRSEIVRKGGVVTKQHQPPTLQEIAKRLGWTHAPKELLASGWEHEEPAWR